MVWYQYFALAALLVCTGNCLFHFIRLIWLGKPVDYSRKTGNTNTGIVYSFTGAMSPKKKESAFLHLPTYSAGLIYHLGTFAAIPVFLLLLLEIEPVSWLRYLLAAGLAIAASCGFAILAKRISVKKLRSLSNPDDYLSNLLVTLFQSLTAFMLFFPDAAPAYFLLSGLLLLYIPVSKLKHLIYFFAARYHLGYFFGWRNVWPPKKT